MTSASVSRSRTRWIRVTGVASVTGAAMWSVGDILLIGANANPAGYPLIFDTYANQIDTAKPP